MPTIRIDNQEVEVAGGATILDAAGKLGIEIPTLCFLPGREPSTSCMACVVKVNGQLIPSCAAKAQEGMVVESETDDVRAVRRAALELLLSDHLGDCMGPCQVICPAGMDIPLMIRQIAAGSLDQAIVTVKRDIAIPAVLGRICPAPCENGCRRRQADQPVAICLLKRYVADVDLASEEPYLPDRPAPSGKKVAIVGAGPAGLSAAYYLLAMGHECSIYDDRPAPGGALRHSVPQDRLPADVLDAEIDVIRRLGAAIVTDTRIGEGISLADLRRDFDAVLLATGTPSGGDAEVLQVAGAGKAIAADRKTFQTDLAGVFAAGNAIRPANKLAVRSAADGKGAATAIDQFLRSLAVIGQPRPFNCRIGKLLEGEIEQFMAGASSDARVAAAGGPNAGYTADQARAESLRCLHCDCRKADDCRLRDYSGKCGASVGRYKAPRRRFASQADHAKVIYEPGKCISCGICIQIAAEHREPLGLTFVGRGFDVRVAVPLAGSLAEGLAAAAAACAAACPTGALASRNS